jgi:DNA polymerase-3 subunit alpha
MMDSISNSRKRNLDGQMGLFSLLDDDDPSGTIPIPKLAEMNRADLMAMEKETTGIYISGHPMDDYRHYLRNTHVMPIGELMEEDCPVKDEQIVSVAGIVQAVKMKTTRNNSMMSYVTVEDDTASIEMLAFSNVLTQYGGYLKENSPIVVTGRLSLRDDKEPQIVINRVRLIADFADAYEAPEQLPAQLAGKLYLKLPSEDSLEFAKTRAILSMFPGENPVVLYFADTAVRRGTTCQLRPNMLNELRNLLGSENVVLK